MSFRTSAKPTRAYKKTIDLEETRKQREQITVQLRKANREEQFAKRRTGASRETIFDETNDNDRSAQEAKISQEVQEGIKMIPTLAKMVMSDDIPQQMEGTAKFRKLLSIERCPPIQEVIDSGVVPRLVQFLAANHNPTLQFEAAWALTNIASGSSKHTKVVVDSGAVRYFVALLKNQNEDVREQAVWALGNIAGDCTAYRDMVLKLNALPPLCDLCKRDQNQKAVLLRNATWTLSNFCRGKPQPPFELVAPALSTLNDLIYSQDDDVLIDACWALSYLSDDTGPQNTKIGAVVASGCVRRVCELLLHKNPKVKTPALRTIGNIVTGDDSQTQAVLNYNVLAYLLALLANSSRSIRKETCWTISNITAGTSDQIEAVIKANLIQPLIKILTEEEFEIQKEAAWAISNATSGGTSKQIDWMVQQGVIPPLCELFHCPDPKIMMVGIEAIENILKAGKEKAQKTGGSNPYCQIVEECGGLKSLEDLQNCENEEIYQKALQVLTDYFEPENDTSMAPAAAASGNFQFGQQNQQQNFNFGNFGSNEGFSSSSNNGFNFGNFS